MRQQIQGKEKREEEVGEEGEQGMEEETGQTPGEEKKKQKWDDGWVNAREKGIKGGGGGGGGEAGQRRVPKLWEKGVWEGGASGGERENEANIASV